MPDIFFLVSAAVLAAGASWSVVCHFSFMPCYSLSPLLLLFSFWIPGDGHVSPVTDMATTALWCYWNASYNGRDENITHHDGCDINVYSELVLQGIILSETRKTSLNALEIVRHQSKYTAMTCLVQSFVQNWNEPQQLSLFFIFYFPW